MTQNTRKSLTILRQLATPVPDIILDLVAQNPQSMSIDLVWSQPNMNGTTFQYYEIQAKKCSDVAFATIGTSTTESYTASGLDSEECYEFRVRTVSVEGPASYGNVDQEETTPDIPIFQNDYAFFAVADITSVYIVSLENSNVITQNGTALPTLNQGQTTIVPASQFDEFIGSHAFYAIGLITNDWFPLNPNYTVGKTFAYGPIRANPQTVSVYAFQDSNVTVTVGGALIAAGFVPANSGANYTYSITNQNVIVESDGLVMVSQTSSNNFDQTVLLPASTKLVGFPSSRARVYPTENDTYWGAYRANGLPFGGGGHEDTTQEGVINNTGNSYSGDSVTVKANKPVSAASFADQDGTKAASFLPTTLMTTHFGIPFVVERMNFANDGTPFSVTTSNGNTYNSSGSILAQYIRITAAVDRAAGTLFTASVPAGAWTEPDIQDQDEIILFGWNI